MRMNVVFVATLVWAAPLAAQQADSLPPGVTAATIADGKKIFAGPGLCSACHGPAAKGVQGLGANLTDKEWLHSDGSYEALVAQITAGVPAGKSSTGVPMPAKGGASLSEAQVRTVAAYVWSLSHAAAR
ncbi:MAG: cytochrome c [Gemmatimonadota bacterium]|nr:cytochrome c [Gemmatimonadota bacterium]MDH4350080.1 cytochrome c [Gemmatimonadota bacterium]